MYQLEYRPRVIKQLKKIPKREQKKIIRKLESLLTNPKRNKSLEGEYKNFHSLRAWPYRIIYQVDKKIITIFSIAHRQSVYKT